MLASQECTPLLHPFEQCLVTRFGTVFDRLQPSQGAWMSCGRVKERARGPSQGDVVERDQSKTARELDALDRDRL